jgi:hypothetical protein
MGGRRTRRLGRDALIREAWGRYTGGTSSKVQCQATQFGAVGADVALERGIHCDIVALHRVERAATVAGCDVRRSPSICAAGHRCRILPDERVIFPSSSIFSSVDPALPLDELVLA